MLVLVRNIAMASFLGLVMGLVSFQSDAQAAVKSTFRGAADEIEMGEMYGLSGVTAQTTAKEVFDEVGKRIRQRYYMDRYEVDGYGGNQIEIDEAFKLLSEAKGEFSGLSTSELEVLKSWVEKNQVEAVQAASISTNFHGGTGLEDLYLFLPKMPASEVLVIRAFWYAE